VVNVSIDGKDVLGGDQLVVNPGETTDLEGFLNGTSVKNKFRFIKKTDRIAEHRGDFIDDGFIRVTWKYEKPKPEVRVVEEKHIHHDHYHDYWYPYPKPYYPPIRPYDPWWDKVTFGSNTSCRASASNDTLGEPCDYDAPMATYSSDVKSFSSHGSPLRGSSIMGSSCNSAPMIKKGAFDNSNEGITVTGADTNQNFYNVHVGELETTERAIVIHLRGSNDKGVAINRPKLVTRRITCPSCGLENRSHNKFCHNCGTRIVDVT